MGLNAHARFFAVRLYILWAGGRYSEYTHEPVLATTGDEAVLAAKESLEQMLAESEQEFVLVASDRHLARPVDYDPIQDKVDELLGDVL